MEAPFGLAVAAGLVAAVNPCGFALLPVYLSFLVIGDAGPTDADRPRPRGAAVGRAVQLTIAMTLGFLAVFGGFGLLAAPVADALARRLPWLTIVIGLALVGVGGWLLAGRSLYLPIRGIHSAPRLSGSLASIVAFGAAYALASLGCTVGPFLSVVFAGADSVPQRFALYLAYAAGMGLAVGTAAVAVALAKQSIIQRIRRLAPVLNRIGGLITIVAGGYVAWYGWYERRVLTGGDTSDPVIDGAAQVQSAISTWLGEFGPAAVAAVLAALIVVAAVTTRIHVRRRAGRRHQQAP